LDTNQDISQEEFDAIEKYIVNDLAHEERTAFETRLSNDATLRAKVTELRLLFVGVNEAVLQEKINDFHQELSARKDGHTIGGRTPTIKKWLVAASIILVAGISGWLLINRQSKEEKLFASFFKPDPGLITAMSATDNYLFERAMIDYKKGDYSAAIKTWDSLQKIQPANDTLNYFLGAAYLADENASEAIICLQKVTALRASFFNTDAYWYLGLAQLKEGKINDAILSIERSAHPGKDELLMDLKKQ